MINGLHAIVYSTGAEEDRSFFSDVLGLNSVDAGGGWLIFAMPPTELAVHPTDGPGQQELYLMCDDIHATFDELRSKGIEVSSEITDAGWGLLSSIKLPSGSDLAIYQPRHTRPQP